jgi:ABC-type Fe3+/spermidine/putrescine transport system ATPase subunit
MLAVECKNICKSWPGGLSVLTDIDLDIADGEMVVMMGPSGAGKTTLIRMIAGLDRPDSGRIALWGQTVDSEDVHITPGRRNVGMVFQDLALWPHLTARRQLELVLRRVERSRRRRRELAESWLERVGLSGRSDHEPARLSGGERRRLALARGMIARPRLLLLDEPFAELPLEQARDLVGMIMEERITDGYATLLVSHVWPESWKIGLRVLLMNGGEFFSERGNLPVSDEPL